MSGLRISTDQLDTDDDMTEYENIKDEMMIDLLPEFPYEIKRHIILIFQNICTPKELIQLRMVCREWQQIIDYDFNSYWRDLVFTKYKIVNLNKTLPPGLNNPEVEEKKKELAGTNTSWIERYIQYTMIEPIITAIKDNRLDLVEKYCQMGCDLNVSFCDSFTTLHHAINLEFGPIAMYLLHNGFTRIDATDLRGETPLHRAAWNNQLDVAKKLIEMGANIEGRNFFGYTALHLAAANGRLEIVRFLIQKGANINAQSNVGNTPLHRAKCRGHPRVVRVLVDKGADQTIRNDHGKVAADYSTITRKNHKLEFS